VGVNNEQQKKVLGLEWNIFFAGITSFLTDTTTKSPKEARLSQPHSMAQTVAATGDPISGLANYPKKC